MKLTRQDLHRRGLSLWCAGLPEVEERRLNREEHAQLRREGWHLIRQGLGTFLGAAIGGVLLMALVSWLGGILLFSVSANASLVVVVLLFCGLLLLLPALLFVRNSSLQRGLLLLRDLRHGDVFVFAGQLMESDRLQTEDGADAAQGHLIGLGLLTLGSAEVQTIEVLPVSRRVWRVGMEEVKPWIETAFKAVAISGESASVWPQESPLVFSNETIRRKLTEVERTELLQEARRHWLGSCVAALLLTGWAALLFIAGAASVWKAGQIVWSPAVWSPWAWNAVHIGLLAFAADTFFLRRWAQAQEMHRDARGGKVLASQDSLGDKSSFQVTETLPHSQRLWTQGGRPAAWRRIGR